MANYHCRSKGYTAELPQMFGSKSKRPVQAAFVNQRRSATDASKNSKLTFAIRQSKTTLVASIAGIATQRFDAFTGDYRNHENCGY
jgi:hypothetical protein